MQTAGTRKRSRNLAVYYTLLVLFVVGLIVLVVLARTFVRPVAPAEIQAILKEAQEDKAQRAAVTEDARKAVDSNKPVADDVVIPASWDFRPILKALDGDKVGLLVTLVGRYLMDGGGVSEAGVERVRKALAQYGNPPAGSPFDFTFTPESVWGADLNARLSAFLLQCKALQEVEAAYKLGLLQDVADAYRNPLESNLTNLCTLLAGKAYREIEAGDAPRALETLLTGYGIAGLLGGLAPLLWSHEPLFCESNAPSGSLALC